MNRQLTQQEIDAVFQDVHTGQSPHTPPKPIPFDFRRPDRIAKPQLRAIHFLHETFTRNVVSSLSAYLRSYLSANLVSVEQLPFAEFLEALPSPTCMISLSLRPYDGNAVLEMNPSLVYPMLEMLLGGKGKSISNTNRKVTEIEQNLLDGVFRLVLRDLSETWKAVAPIEFRIDTLETEPQFLQILAPNEAVVAIGMEFRIGDNVGMMNLAMPSITIKMMRQKFDQQWLMRKTDPGEAEQTRMLQLLRASSFVVDAQLSGSGLRVRDLLELAEGDVITFDHAIDRQLDCVVNGRRKFKGGIVATPNNKKAFVVEQPEREAR